MQANRLFTNMTDIGTQLFINNSTWEVIEINAYKKDMRLELLTCIDKELIKAGVICNASDLEIKKY